MRRQLTALVAIVGLGLALAGCKKAAGPSGGGGGGGGGTSVTVSIPVTDYGGNQTPSFSPSAIAVPAGGSVTWRNADTVAHTSTSDTNIWNGSLAPGDSYTRTFATPGTFPYVCTIHSGMSGRVIVQ